MYGMLIQDIAIILTNAITFVPTLIILIITVKDQVQTKNGEMKSINKLL